MSITVVPVPKKSVHFPTIKPTQPVEVTERDPPGFLVALIEATDVDNDTLWYDIVGKLFLFSAGIRFSSLRFQMVIAKTNFT